MPEATTTQIRGWVEACRRGDPAARDQLLVHTRDRLAAIARGRRGGADLETAEILQELYVRLLTRWDEVIRPPDEAGTDPARDFFGRAARLIRDVLIDHARRVYGRNDNRRPAASLDALAGSGDSSAAGFDPGTGTHDPARAAQWAEVHAAINDLPDPLREVVDRYWYHGLTHAEVAAELGIAEVTARARWAKARHWLRERFPDTPFDWAE